MKRVFLLFFLILIIAKINCLTDKEVFEQSIILYNNGKYNEAISDLKILLNKGYNNFEINYNLGCCYFKLNKYGFARFYFEKALYYKPFDRELYNNLVILYNKILKNPEAGIQEIMTKRLIFFLPLNVLIIIFIITFLIFFLMLIAIFNFVKIRKIALVLFSIFLFFNIIVVFIFFLQYMEFNKKEFVCISTTNIYIAPNRDNILFSVTEGTKGVIKDEFNNFIKVYLSDGTSGWIKKEAVVY